ncbi:MAG: hypothetical protein LUC31_02915 [Coprobacillus sp.]|nr:hypothetical protein [Coprobacillus sp.]
MRRFWAYIILCVTTLLVMGTTITKIVVNTDANIEYQDGREIVFRVSDRDDYSADLDEGVVEDVAATMDERLQNIDMTAYEIVVQGDDTIKVTFSQSYASDYDNIKYYLSFNGTFALGVMNDQVIPALDNEWRSEDEAYLKTINGYPAICIPVVRGASSGFDRILNAALQQVDDEIGEETVEEVDEDADEDAEPETIITTYMYLWGNYVEGVDSWEKTQEDSPNYDERVASKILMKFDVTNGGYYLPNNDDEDVICTYINVDQDDDGYSTVSEREAAYSDARYLVNILNTDAYDYDVTFIYESVVDAWVDNVVSYGNRASIAWSETLGATLIALLLMIIALAFVYKWLCTATFVLTSVSMFAAVGLSVALSVEFTTAGIVGILLLMLASCLSSVMYFNKFKEECYKGRSIKKANSDARKRSLWPIFDINLVLIIIGACAYLLGGAYMASFAAVTVLGGVASMLCNTFLLNGSMLMITGNHKWVGAYDKFGMNRELIPDTSKGETQTYLAPNQDRVIVKRPKTMGIICGVFFVASLAGLITFGCVSSDHNFFNSKNATPESQIYFETTAETSTINNDSIHKFLDKIYIGEYDFDSDIQFTSEALHEEYMTIEDYVIGIDDYYQNILVDEEYVDYYFYIVSLQSTDVTSETICFYVGSEENAVEDIEATNGLTVNDVIIYASGQQTSGIVDSKATIEIKDGEVVSTYTPDLYKIILATAVGLAVSAIYLMFRYRPSRGLATLVTTTVAGTVTIGIFALIRVMVAPALILALPFTVTFGFMIAIFQMSKEKEMVTDSKKRELLPQDRYQIMSQSTTLIFSIVILALCLLVLGGFSFFGFGAVGTYVVYLGIIIGGLIATFVSIELLGPLSQWFYRRLSRYRINRKPKADKKKKKPVQHTSEPEEAIFIGIND